MEKDGFANNVIWLTSIKNSLNEVGLKVVDPEHCCKLLATVYLYGGGNSDFTSDLNLVADIKVAQELLNMKGGEIINLTMYLPYEHFFIEAQKIEQGNSKTMPDWAVYIFNFYKLKIPKQ